MRAIPRELESPHTSAAGSKQAGGRSHPVHPRPSRVPPHRTLHMPPTWDIGVSLGPGQVPASNPR